MTEDLQNKKFCNFTFLKHKISCEFALIQQKTTGEKETLFQNFKKYYFTVEKKVFKKKCFFDDNAFDTHQIYKEWSYT